MGLPGALFSPSSKNKKKPTPQKCLIFQDMELSSSNIKKIVIFYEKKAFLIVPEMEPARENLLRENETL